MNKIEAFLDNFHNGDLSDGYFASEMKANGGINLIWNFNYFEHFHGFKPLKIYFCRLPEINLQNVCKMACFFLISFNRKK